MGLEEAPYFITDDGVSDVFHMDTDLIFTAGFEGDIEEREVIGGMDEGVMGDGQFTEGGRIGGVDEESFGLCEV